MSTGQVVTFHSVKGGTGRTMALANVAWILATSGKRVLAADWNLVSPGLHRLFRPFLRAEAAEQQIGVINMVRGFEDQATGSRRSTALSDQVQVARHVMAVDGGFPGGGGIDLLPAGRENTDYAAPLSAMNWDRFYHAGDGARFFDAVRTQLRRDYDVALIDGCSGQGDLADICTAHLPDTLVACFTLSRQGMESAATAAAKVQERYPRIRVLPVPMRVDLAERQKADAGRAVARRLFAGLPTGMTEQERAAYWHAVEVPYQPVYAYEDRLAVFGEAPDEKNRLREAFENLAAHLTR
ncbi:ParA family protein [Catellatospora paridis]|uniref:ParA family protein n=1 Tax=Catellatospora paridis TaxID=1617086 RepID=UPI0038B2CED1